MMTDKELKERDCTPIEDFITENFGCPGTAERDEFESGCETFIIGERLKAGMTQEQLAARVGTKKKLYIPYRKWTCGYTTFYSFQNIPRFGTED